MKCEGYGHIQAECANTWSDDKFEACNEEEDICNESMALVSLSTTKKCSGDMTIYLSSPPVDPSTYESHVSMTELGPSDVATTDVESDDVEEISYEEMTHSYKIMYEKLVEAINENRGLLKHITQCVERKMSSSNKSLNNVLNELTKIELIKQVFELIKCVEE